MAKEISLYVHLPFCRKKCPYCSFFVLPYSKESEDLLLKALILHLDQISPQLKGRNLVSVYFGGGTPSVVSSDFLQTLVKKIRALPVAFDPALEWTLEANPEDVSKEFAALLFSLGIHRVSLGVQSFVDKELVFLGRSANKGHALTAIENLLDANITNISIDLIFELMNQTKGDLIETLKVVKDLPITHLSLYNLMIEEGSKFYRSKEVLEEKRPPDALCVEMLDTAVATLESYGFERYEISAFCKKNQRSRHNTGYWTAREFVGIGPSAWSFFGQKRSQCTKNLNKYYSALASNKDPIEYEEELDAALLQKEQAGLLLRLKEGIPKTPLLAPSIEQAITKLIHKGWIQQEENSYILTESGKKFYDLVQMELL